MQRWSEEHCDKRLAQFLASEATPEYSETAVQLKHLRYAEAAERHGSFRRAAAALAVEPSNLSRRIRDLEDWFGVTLFTRTNSGVLPTRAGQQFTTSARRILDELQRTIDRAKASGRGEVGRLTLGLYASLSTSRLRASLAEYALHFPRVEIVIVEGSKGWLCDNVKVGSIDAAILTEGGLVSGCRSMALWNESIIAALPERHLLTAKEVIYWTDLKRERLLLTKCDPGPEILQVLSRRLSCPSEPPTVVTHDVSPESIKSLVAAGQGVSLLCEAHTNIPCPGVAYREVHDANGEIHIGYSACWREVSGNPALHNFIRLLKRRYPLVARGNGNCGAVSQTPDQWP